MKVCVCVCVLWLSLSYITLTGQHYEKSTTLAPCNSLIKPTYIHMGDHGCKSLQTTR